ncbi:MAG: glycosyltransferase [Rhodocyclaceae bacterium]|nr:glycosyltransferase [Rhodocyclaceae bacterium]
MTVRADFSIVTPSFNQARFVGRTLTSVASQTGVHVQHIVVDPGSTDGSQDIIRKFPDITFVQKPDRCQSEGINNGFVECTGRYVAWLNSDDLYVSPDALAQVKRCFESHPHVDIVYGKAIFVDADDQFIRDYYVNGKAESLKESFEYQVGICQPAVFWKREVYEELGGLDESLDFQLDFEYWIRMAQAGKVWKHIAVPIAAHRWWEGMKTASRRDRSLQETLNLMKQRFGYVHWKWAERLANLQVNADDGIINVGKGDDERVRLRTIEILHRVNTDAVTLEHMQSPSVTAGARETLERMRSFGTPTTPRFHDALNMRFTTESPRFLFAGDEMAASPARRPEIRRQAKTGLEFVTYAAEPNFQVACLLTDFQTDQTRLSDMLERCDKAPGRTCVVVANGPSLRQSLNEDLFAFDLIISNFAYKDERLLQRARYYTIVNHTVAAQVRADWMYLDHLVKVFPFWLGRHVPDLPQTFFVNSTVDPAFSPDARRNLSWRSTVSYFNMQLAVSLGYRQVLLVGFDNSYIQPQTVKEGDELIQKTDDPNHFMPGYFKGKTWQAADTGNMNDSYCQALSWSMANGVKFINCTVGGQLHAFPRDQLGRIHSGMLPKRPPNGRWRALNPGEIVAAAHDPAWRELLATEPRVSAGAMPKQLDAFLVEQARTNGRGLVFPQPDDVPRASATIPRK